MKVQERHFLFFLRHLKRGTEASCRSSSSLSDARAQSPAATAPGREPPAPFLRAQHQPKSQPAGLKQQEAGVPQGGTGPVKYEPKGTDLVRENALFTEGLWCKGGCWFFKLVSGPWILREVFCRDHPPMQAALGSEDCKSCLPYYGKSLQATLLFQASKRSPAFPLLTERSH